MSPELRYLYFHNILYLLIIIGQRRYRTNDRQVSLLIKFPALPYLFRLYPYVGMEVTVGIRMMILRDEGFENNENPS